MGDPQLWGDCIIQNLKCFQRSPRIKRMKYQTFCLFHIRNLKYISKMNISSIFHSFGSLILVLLRMETNAKIIPRTGPHNLHRTFFYFLKFITGMFSNSPHNFFKTIFFKIVLEIFSELGIQYPWWKFSWNFLRQFLRILLKYYHLNNF